VRVENRKIALVSMLSNSLGRPMPVLWIMLQGDAKAAAAVSAEEQVQCHISVTDHPILVHILVLY
jgi:hypothetical protein